MWQAVRFVVTVGLSAWIIALVDWTAFLHTLGSASPWIVGIVVVLRFGGLVLSSYKWQHLLAVHSVRYRLARLLRWYLVGSFLNHFLPSSIGGDGYRIYRTWANERGRAVSVLAVVLERMTGMAALAALGYASALVLLLAGRGPLVSGVAIAGSLCLLVAALAVGLSSRFDLLGRLRGSRFGRYVHGLAALVSDFRDQPLRTSLVVGLSFAFHLNKLVVVWLLLFTLGASADPLQLMVALFIVELAGLLPISLGGLGVVEGSFMVVMAQFGVADEISLATMLLLRVLMLPFYLAGAIFYFLDDGVSTDDADDGGGSARMSRSVGASETGQSRRTTLTFSRLWCPDAMADSRSSLFSFNSMNGRTPMHPSRLSAVPLVVATALAFAACENAPPTAPSGDADVAFSVNGGATSEQCTVVDFTSFDHGDPVTALTVNTVPLTLSAIRFDGGVSVDPTAYDVELTGAALAALDDTHDDTQAERDCDDCVGHGRTLVVPDEDFATGGDNTEGGSITITGFAADPDPTAVWEVTDFDVIDGDEEQGFTTLYVDDVQTAQSTRTGNATVEDVSVPANTINTDIEFEIGAIGTDASSGIDNIRLCRTTTEEGGEGCTPGYWKQPHHFDSWQGYDPSDLYCDVFGVGPCDTLLKALKTGGGGAKALGRHSVAALLNAASADVSYDMFVADLISAVQDAYADGTKGAFNSLKDVLEGFNEQNCPLN
ncbi:MAG: lysylphosphatidylglycerol synthase transmembrane domain-containing protein [Gemmatimonadota bacterium]